MGDPIWVGSFQDLPATARRFHDKAVDVAVEQAVLWARSMSHHFGGDLRYGEEMRVRREAREKAEAAFSDIPGLFQSFADAPDPARFEPAVESLHQAQASLATSAVNTDPLTNNPIVVREEFAKITTTSDFIDDWSGAAAHEFKANYLDPLPAKIGAQFQLAAILAAAIQAEQAIWQAARSDIRLVLAKGLAALDHVGECTQAQWTITFTVVASIAAVAAVPFAGGLSLRLTAVGAASQVVAAIPIDDAAEEEYAGDTAFEVVGQVRQGVQDLISRIARAEQVIGGRLGDNVAVVHANWRQFVSDRPALDDATPANVTGPAYFGFAH
ncbi:hypothetical protein Drose_13125 [Dactylosporangium roseum]|uniref:ESX-1 secretion-associated protein EspA/EspE-like domain-containing protein n=1 Tax=Dactylosporangium roseum TaxID=47989 RepID=A0ABY5ZBW1_9ACTN|nr:hypothetical protein [Dactylosporangium roseum]UWZ39076.1 hypothetical protein Drose_13125 [Dactylosporangium roseum]